MPTWRDVTITHEATQQPLMREGGPAYFGWAVLEGVRFLYELTDDGTIRMRRRSTKNPARLVECHNVFVEQAIRRHYLEIEK